MNPWTPTALIDDVTGDQYTLGADGLFYFGSIGYKVEAGDKAPGNSGGTLIPQLAWQGTGPKQGAIPGMGDASPSPSPGSPGMGASPQAAEGLTHRSIVRAMLKGIVEGKASPQVVAENLIKVTSPLQINQQATLDALLDAYAHLPATEDKTGIDALLSRFDADPLYTVDMLAGDLAKDPSVPQTFQAQVLDIVTRFNLTIPN